MRFHDFLLWRVAHLSKPNLRTLGRTVTKLQIIFFVPVSSTIMAHFHDLCTIICFFGMCIMYWKKNTNCVMSKKKKTVKMCCNSLELVCSHRISFLLTGLRRQGFWRWQNPRRNAQDWRKTWSGKSSQFSHLSSCGLSNFETFNALKSSSF